MSDGMPSLDDILSPLFPEIRKWATVVIVEPGAAASEMPKLTWHHFRNQPHARDFWPASCIKLYTVVAAVELLNELGLPLESVVAFERRSADGRWILDAARSVKEMLGEVFRRSSNEDYTLLLRMVGLDRLNTKFLIPEKGFTASALMRGYVTGRPYSYIREEPQRITVHGAGISKSVEHTWSGTFYSEARGATIIDSRTGNVASTRDMVECLMKLVFHDKLPAESRFSITAAQAEFILRGGDGFVGMETKAKESGPAAWINGVEKVFPNARYYHKCGLISNYCLEVAFVDDLKDSGKQFLLVPVVNAGLSTKPKGGEEIIGALSRAISEWVRGA
jgi:hypothetical protein